MSRLLFSRSYFGKIFLLVFAAVHVPLMVLIGYLVMVSGLDGTQTRNILLIAIVATVIGTMVALMGLWVLLTPVAQASQTLDGYRMTGSKPPFPMEMDGEGDRLLAHVHYTLSDLDRVIAQLRESASRDGLTGVFNRREGERRLGEELAARQHGAAQELALIILDADGLKKINDRWGHAAGDICLRHLTSTIVSRIASDGWVARWGGDEFVAVLPHVQGRPAAEAVLDVITAELARSNACLPTGQQVRVEFSAGIAMATPGDDALTLLERADAALYKAKRARKARILRVPESA